MTREEFKKKVNNLSCHLRYPILDDLHAIDDHDAEQRATIERSAQEIAWLKERDEVAKWYESLVTRAKIGTSQTPSLKAYIEQCEQEIARLREALENLVDTLGGDSACRLDHHGLCQEHFLNAPCEVHQAQQALKETTK